MAQQFAQFEALQTNPYQLLQVLDWLQLSRYQKGKIFFLEDRQRDEMVRELDR